MRIVAIDQSMSCTGIATYDGDNWTPDVADSAITVRSVKTKPDKGQAKSPLNLVDRMCTILGEISEEIEGADQVVIEGPSYGSQTPTAHMLGGLFYMVLYEIFIESAITPVIVSPKQLKKLATGNGNAKKIDVVIAARERLGFEGTDDNEADARWLLEAGLQLHALPAMAELPKKNLEGLAKLR